MERPTDSIEKLTADISLLLDDIGSVLEARQEILSKMGARTHTQEDIRAYIILSKRMISTLERKKQTIEKIKKYYEENDPENIHAKYWLHELEATTLEIEANKSALDEFLSGGQPTARTEQLFRQAAIAREKAIASIRSSEDRNQRTAHLPGLAQDFFSTPGSYDNLALGKFMRYDGTELILPNCGIRSFHRLQEYGEKLERDFFPTIQRSNTLVADIKRKVLTSTHKGNPKVLEILHRVEKMEEAKTKKAEELRRQLEKIRERTVLPVTIDEQLEIDLLVLDKLHGEFKEIMLATNHAISELKALTTNPASAS